MGSANYLVQKYGGTSVSTPERRQQVVGHVRRARENGYQVDDSSGVLVLGLSEDKQHELAAVKAELGDITEVLNQEQAWVSLIGVPNEDVRKEGLMSLEKNQIDVLYQESSERRHTYVVPARDGKRSVEILYDAWIGH